MWPRNGHYKCGDGVVTICIRQRDSVLPHEAMQYQADTKPVPGPNVTLHLLDESGVLFNAGTQQLYNLNTTATFIWCCLEEGLDQGEILRALAQTFGFDAHTAEAHATEIIRQWRQLGLLGPSGRGNSTLAASHCLNADRLDEIGRASWRERV